MFNSYVALIMDLSSLRDKGYFNIRTFLDILPVTRRE